MADPFEIYIGGSKLENWTSATLKRAKKELTGNLSVEIFAGHMPSQPLVRSAVAGAEILAYVAGKLAFTGNVDSRQGVGSRSKKSKDTKSDVTGNTSIGPDSYTMSISARGKTKVLVDGSHQHDTSTVLKKTDKGVCEELLKKKDVQLDWQASETKLDKARFRDGATVVEELRRLGSENALYIYEDAEGKLRVCDGPVGSGPPIVLGENILTFDAEQTQAQAKSLIEVKGHMTDKLQRGKARIEKRIVEVKDAWAKGDVPLTIQHYGNGTDEALEKRGRFEADKRAQEAKNIRVTVFNVEQDGQIWDIGALHYVEVPPEGIFDEMECVELEYKATPTSIQTSMTLAPPPAKSASGSRTLSGGGPLGIASISGVASIGLSRRASFGLTLEAGLFPDPWGSAELSVSLPQVSATVSVSALGALASAKVVKELP